MRKIYKYPIIITDRQIITAPGAVGIVDIAVQNNQTYAWVLVEPGKEEKSITILMFGTGHEITEEFECINKFIKTLHVTPYVWHIFQEVNINES